MTPSILLAIGAMVSGAWSDLLYKRAQTLGIDATSFLFLQSTIFFATIWVVELLLGVLWGAPPDAWIYGLPAGLIAYTGLLLFVRSLQVGEASVNVPIFRLSFVITAVIAVLLLGESTRPTKMIGLVLAALAVLSLLIWLHLNGASGHWLHS